MMKHTYYIENMTCINCAKVLENALSKLDGVRQVTAKHSRKVLSVDADFTVIPEEDIIDVIRNRRYTVVRIINCED